MNLNHPLEVIKCNSMDRITSRNAPKYVENAGQQGLCSLHSPEFRKPIEAACDTALAEVQARAEAVWGLNRTIKARRDWTFRTSQALRARSRGGWYSGWTRGLDEATTLEEGPAISLRFASLPTDLTIDSICDWVEYARIQNDPKIGTRCQITVAERIRFIVAHEGAHAVQFWAKREAPTGVLAQTAQALLDSGKAIAVGATTKDRLWGAHEAVWQVVYGDLRDTMGLNALGRLPTTSGAETTCIECGEAFNAKRADAKFCSAKCRVAAHRAGL